MHKVHGMEASYNDIATWQYSTITDRLRPAGSRHRVKKWKIRSRPELEALLNGKESAHGEGLQVSTRRNGHNYDTL